ncbi:MAG TPA: endonuclease VIII, partial [Sedimenticola thiotaurini]|nr:endonuclease VIII [Sedimenticola thiotaurini]
EPLKRFEAQLSGALVTGVDTRGKAMLTRFGNGLTIYSHNQLYGRWYLVPRGETPQVKRQLRLAIHTRRHSALLYSASEIQVLTPAQEAAHPFLSRLGPDVLDPATTPALALERLRQRRFSRRRLGALLTDQGFVAGLGNYLRCEILFLAGLAPSQRPVDCGPERLESLSRLLLELPRRSFRTGGITNDPDAARALMENGASFEQARFHLFRRAGLPCYRCGTPIERISAGGQACYVCPRCQPGRPA